MPATALQIADAAFGCAGQRCTATRRVIVLARIYDAFIENLVKCTRALAWGAPDLEMTRVGPLLSARPARRVASCVDRAREEGCEIIQPHSTGPDGPAFYPPTIIFGAQADLEIVQEETFGPVLIVQRALDGADAIRLLNGVRQGLAAVIFQRPAALGIRFRRAKRAT